MYGLTLAHMASKYWLEVINDRMEVYAALSIPVFSLKNRFVSSLRIVENSSLKITMKEEDNETWHCALCSSRGTCYLTRTPRERCQIR